MSVVTTPRPVIQPLLEQLVSRHGFTPIDEQSIEAFVSAAGHTLLVFTEDPVRYKETLDLAVIAPEIARAFGGRFRVGVLFPHAARKVAPRYGFTRWPALVVLKDGAYVGAIGGLRTWDNYLEEILQLLTREPARQPSVVIAVRPADPSAPGCGH